MVCLKKKVVFRGGTRSPQFPAEGETFIDPVFWQFVLSGVWASWTMRGMCAHMKACSPWSNLPVVLVSCSSCCLIGEGTDGLQHHVRNSCTLGPALLDPLPDRDVFAFKVALEAVVTGRRMK